MSQPITPEFVQSMIPKGQAHVLVLLKEGPTRDQSEAEASAIQMAHLQYLFGLMRDGKLVINGPTFEHPEIRGISIYRSGDPREVEALVQADPGVVAGRLSYELHAFFSVDGWGFPPQP